MNPHPIFWPILAAVLSGAFVQGGILLVGLGRFAQELKDMKEMLTKLDLRTDRMKGGCPLHTHHCPLSGISQGD